MATAAARRRLIGLVLLASLLLAGVGVGGYFLWDSDSPALPDITTEGLDPEVVKAITEARARVEKDPDSADAWGRLGMVLFAHDMYDDGIPVLRTAERLDPGEARWTYLLGLALILQQPEEGVATLRRAVERSPRSFAMRLRLAEELLKLGRIDEAEPLFRGLLAERPGNPRSLLGTGQILLDRGDCEEAIAPLELAAEDPTARRSARVALAEAYSRTEQADRAASLGREAAEVGADLRWPDPVLDQVFRLRTGLAAGIDAATEFLDDGQLREAHDVITRVLHKYPQSDEGHLILGKVLMRAGEISPAESALSEAVRLNPELVEGHLILGDIRASRDDFAAAERSYRRATELKPTHAEAHLRLGECRLKQGNRAGAIAALRDAVRCRPDLAETHLKFGELLLQDGRTEEALEHLSMAVHIDGGNPRARELLAQAGAGRDR